MRTNFIDQRSIARRMTFLSWITVFAAALFGAGTLPDAQASEEELVHDDSTIGLNDVSRGSLLINTDRPGRYIPAPMLKTDVRVSVTGIIARTTVSQEFTNPSYAKEDWVEGIYVFPLPDTAAVDHLRMKVGERIIEGQIKERTEAKKIYEQAKREGKRAGLVEQERPNIFTTSVANIGPRDKITVEIEYQETVSHNEGRFSIRFPMVIGPRYIPGTPVIFEDQPPGPGWGRDTDRVSDAGRITPPVQHPHHGPINPLSLTVDLQAGFPLDKVESAHHPILTIAEPDGSRHITLREDSVPANRDFQLTWQPASEIGLVATVHTQEEGGNSYAFLMVTPPTTTQSLAQLPRETIFIIDTSGSMAGTSIEQAKTALLLALTRLTAQDRFNIIQFNSVTHLLFSQAEPVTTDTVRRAVRYVERLSANGGTEILPALKMALKTGASATHLRQIIFLTDGQVGNEDELFEVIRAQLGPSRLFTIGIGSAPNSHFMRKAAEFGRGTFTHIGSTKEVKEQMDLLFRKLERPRLTDIRVEGLDNGVEIFPTRIPDLYDGEPLNVVLKSSSLPHAVTIQGLVGSTPWKMALSLKEKEPRDGLSVYWARQKIASIIDQQRFGQDDATIRKAVLDVALPYHLVSKYTSLVAVDITPVRPADQTFQTHALKTNLPEGQEYHAIFGMPNTATSGSIQILIGLAMLALTCLVWGYCKQVA